MKEVWKTIKGFDKYEISNLGKIDKICKHKRVPIKVYVSNSYIFASLTDATHRTKQVNVRRIMDECFNDHIYKDHLLDDLEGEEWRDVVGWENSYEVSNFGRVRTKERLVKRKGNSVSVLTRKLKQCYIDEDGYARVSLYEDGRTQLLGLHRVVAAAFVPNPNNFEQVNHINGIKEDNRASNLEWVTNTQNIRHSIETGLRDPYLHSRSVIRLSDNVVFSSIAELHRSIGMQYNELVHLFKIADGQPVCIDGYLYKCIES